MRFPPVGVNYISEANRDTVAVFLHRSDAVTVAHAVRRETGYAITARLSRRYWYVRLHRLECRCGCCPTLRSNGRIMVR